MTALADQPTVVVHSCDHCGCSEKRLALDASPWTLMQCTNCGFVFTSPRLSNDALAGLYSDEYYENAASYAAQQIQSPSDDHVALAGRARRYLRCRRNDLRSVDVGCGGGRLVEAFSQEGFDASGVEPSEGTVSGARAAGRNVAVADVADLPDDNYDCVTAIHVLEHVTSPSDFMAHLFRITKPGGLCIVEVPNFHCRAAKKQGANWYALHPSAHLSHFTPESLTNCMRKAGFAVRSVHRLGGAGVFADVSEATARKKQTGHAESATGQGLSQRALALVWRIRAAVVAVPATRRLGRWVNWELLGHGEFVRIFAIKPAAGDRPCGKSC